jgi:hypothetical protein
MKETLVIAHETYLPFLQPTVHAPTTLLRANHDTAVETNQSLLHYCQWWQEHFDRVTVVVETLVASIHGSLLCELIGQLCMLHAKIRRRLHALLTTIAHIALPAYDIQRRKCSNSPRNSQNECDQLYGGARVPCSRSCILFNRCHKNVSPKRLRWRILIRAAEQS